MNTIIQITALGVLVLIAALIVGVIIRQMSLLKLAKSFQEQDRERLKAQIEVLRASGAAPKTSAWNGVRQFHVIAKPKETEDICSFFLKPIDGKPLPPFMPGQFLTFELNPPGSDSPLVRCYSLSDSHNPDYYRVSIKRNAESKNSPSGSQFFHDHVSVGSVIKVRAPGGSFVRNPADDRPSVFLSSGVGITPVMSMLQAICDAPPVKGREIWFVFGCRDGKDHVMKKVLHELARNNPWLKLNVCYSKPTPSDKEGVDFQHKGRVSVELLKKILPSNNYAYYICGPPPMMNSLIADLKTWGVPDRDVHYEAFGPESVEQAGEVTLKRVQKTLKVKFAMSGKEESYGTDKPLLSLAEKCSKNIQWGCRSGSCGSCKTLVQSGEVTYANPPAANPESGYCLPCVAIAKTNLVLEA